MTRPRRLETVIAEIAALGGAVTGAEAQERLLFMLRNEASQAVAKVAALVEEYSLTALAPGLEAAFERFMGQPEADKGCAARTAIARTLLHTSTGHADLYRRGIVYRQMEPVWGGSVDAAAGLRGLCAAGLVLEVSPDEALVEVAPVLADPEREAREAAVRALAMLGGAGAEALLRFKLAQHEEEPAIVEACLAALLAISQASLPYVAQFLESARAEEVEAAAFALGESRRDDAFEPLRLWLLRTVDERRQRLAVVAIASLRMEAATAFLLDRLAHGSVAQARPVVEALSVHAGYDEALREALERAVEERGEPALTAMLRRSRPSRR